MRKEGDKFPLRMLLLISQIGITMMVPIFLCAWLGALAAKKTGMEILFVVFVVIGVMAGFRSCYHIIRRFTSLKSDNPEAQYDAGTGQEKSDEEIQSHECSRDDDLDIRQDDLWD